MTKHLNYIKCKFCEWKTNRWGHGTNPHKAFKRLRSHLVEYHAEHLSEEMLDMMEANEAADWESN